MQLGVFVDEALSFVDSHGMPLDAVAAVSYTHLDVYKRQSVLRLFSFRFLHPDRGHGNYSPSTRYL